MGPLGLLLHPYTHIEVYVFKIITIVIDLYPTLRITTHITVGKLFCLLDI